MFKLRCLKTLMFCFVEDNKIISGIVIYNYGPGLRTTDFKILSVVRGCRPGDNLLSSLHYICLSYSPGCLLRYQIFTSIVYHFLSPVSDIHQITSMS